MGLGKTIATLTAFDILQLTEPGPILIIAPLRVATSVWKQEAAKWDHLKHMTVSIMVGNKEQRLQAFKTKADIHVINYNNLVWLYDTCVEHKIWPWVMICADESTRLKSLRTRQGGKRARALAKVAFLSKVKRMVLLTGTPSPNGLADLYGQIWFIDKGERLGKSYSAFMNRWFYKPFLNAFNFLPHAHAQKEIEDKIKDVCLSIKTEDYFELDKAITIDVPVTLPPAAMKLYKAMEKELFLEVNSKEVEALNAASKSIKCLQISNGAIYTDENRNFEVIHDAKLDALEDIVEESAGANIIIIYHFKSDLLRLKSRFPQGIELGKDPSTIDQWNVGKIPILFIHPASSGFGVNLATGGNIMVFYAVWWDLEQYMQVIERAGPMRQKMAGLKRNVFIYTLRAVGTIDSVVIARRESKRSVQDSLLEAARQGVK
jgi:SNF2 family DNA or RNA helicase